MGDNTDTDRCIYTDVYKYQEDYLYNLYMNLEKIDKISGVSFDWSDDFVKDHGGEDGYFVRKKDVGVIKTFLNLILGK